MGNKPRFREREDGLLEYCGSTDITVVTEAWETLDAQIDVDVWGQASIAAAVTPSWDKSTIKEFADQVEKSFGYIYKIAKTYKYYTDPRNCPRVQKLSFKHHTIALRHPNPQAALLHARENGMSCVRLEEWILEEVGSGRAKGRSAMSEIQLSELRQFLEHVEEVIQEDFIANCPDKPFAVRVFGAWLREAREENKQLYINDIRNLVCGAIDDRGARTVSEIVKSTGIREIEVSAAVKHFVEEGRYEWIEQGGETEAARGSNAKVLHRVGERAGSDYSAPRTTIQYVN